jgi:hypothetical protein
MKLVLALVLSAVLAPHSALYVKGHSRAAGEVREKLADVTCFQVAPDPASSAGLLQVDHVFRSGRSWLVMYLTDGQRKVLWERKAEEYPWPIPSPLDRLLRNLAKSTCSDRQTWHLQKTPAPSTASASLPASQH